MAAEVVRLIKGGRENCIKIADKPLDGGDIAILVRTAAQGEAMRRTLEGYGVSAIAVGKADVFDSEEADGLRLLLKAIAHSHDRDLRHQALASSLLGFDHRQMAELVDHDANWQHWAEQFQQLQQLWLSRGFIAMFQTLMQCFELGLKLAGRDRAERRLTNLLQLGELLQQQSVRSGGIDQLLNWFHHQCHQSASEEAELRLESEQSLVKITTIHKSKGLNIRWCFYPVCGIANRSTAKLIIWYFFTMTPSHR